MIKISKLLSKENTIHPFIYGALISRIISNPDNSYFATISAYQESKYVPKNEFNFNEYIPIYCSTLNDISESTNWLDPLLNKNSIEKFKFRIAKIKAIYIIENDLNLTKEEFFNKLYNKLFTDENNRWLFDNNFNESKRLFISAYCELRGSIDTTAKFISLDFFSENKYETRKITLLNEDMSVPIQAINLNFRELQNDFIQNINKRNTQLRINLFWYLENIGIINEYKARIILNAYNLPLNIRGNFKFSNAKMYKNVEKNVDLLKRIFIYTNLIYGNKLTEDQIKKYRKELLEIDEIDNLDEKKRARNRFLVDYVIDQKPDKCAGCHNIYDIKNRSFIHKKTNKFYFEVHHNIPFSVHPKSDDVKNMVKLCPVCHKCLSKNIANAEIQKKIIESILDFDNNALEFASDILEININQKEKIIEEIFQLLA